MARDPKAVTVLVADDEPPVRTVARLALERAGYRVLVAGGGAEALAVAAAHPGPIDLLLTDVDMPGMDGPALWAALAPGPPRPPVLFMSGRPRPNLPGPLLAKPFSLAGLAEQVAAALGEGR